MPGFDGTGPAGTGPKTGRARGKCDGATATAEFGKGRCLGRGCGQGRGLRRKALQQ